MGPLNFSIISSANWCWFKAIPINLLVAYPISFSPIPESSVLFCALIQFYKEQQETLPVFADIWQGIPPYFLQVDRQVSQIGLSY